MTIPVIVDFLEPSLQIVLGYAQKKQKEQNGLTPMVNMHIRLVKFQSARAASHQPAIMGSHLTISHICMPSLLRR